MRKLSVELQTVTPLLLGGANQQGAAELRAPAFRASARFWLRALLGGAIGDSNDKSLHKLEGIVFGDTNTGSAISMRIQMQGDPPRTKANILPHKSGGTGVRDAISADATFSLELLAVRPVSDLVWQFACVALSTSLALGGIGLRSRRGYGTLRVNASSDTSLIPISPATLDEWRSHISSILTMGIEKASALALQARCPVISKIPTSPTRFSCASDGNKLRITASYNSAMNAVTKFMSVVPKSQSLGGISPPEASPLWIHPVYLGEEKWGLLLVLLASKLKQGTDYMFVNRFLDRFPGADIKVKGWNE